jgi:putative intracellular protease/amidase
MTKTIGALIFPGFELLDMFGPLEMFGMVEGGPNIQMIAETLEPVASRQGPATVIDATLADRTAYDVLLVPGGPGTRTEVQNSALLEWLGEASDASDIVATVCTGSALLARTGRLDGVSGDQQQGGVWLGDRAGAESRLESRGPVG